MIAVARYAALALVVGASATAGGQSTPKNGVEVLQRMHDAYAGKWYRTLTFVQKTTTRRADGTDTVMTWFESLRHTDSHGTQLRIDIGSPTSGRGTLYTADSSWRVRDGKPVLPAGGGNEFLPLIEGVYMQPVSRTVAELKPTKVDMERVTSGRWRDRAVWIVGASSPSDTVSPQFWIDADRKVVVRMIVPIGANASLMDIHLDGYVPLAGGWLATKIVMHVGGVPRQSEEYSEWKANVDLPASLFDLNSWMTAPHWAVVRPKP